MNKLIWVINASPLILLGKLDRLDLLEALGTQPMVPQAVLNEIAAGKEDATTMRTLDWAQTRIQPDLRIPASIHYWAIGAGESQVLTHCLHNTGSRAILDDGKARAAAAAHSIPVLGTLGIILRAKRAGKLQLARPLVEQLKANGSWLSADLVEKALEMVGESKQQQN